MPYWLSDAHETYLVMQSCPQYSPSSDEVSDFRLRVMAEIHQMYDRRQRREQAEMLAKMMGGGNG